MNHRNFVCPDCASVDQEGHWLECRACGWTRIDEDGVQNWLSKNDRDSDLAERYIETYESLARKNLEVSNIDRRFLKNQAKNLMRYVGPVTGLDVCDVGVGQGFLADLLKDGNVRSLACVDVSRAYLDRFRNVPGVYACLANAETLPFRDSFDLLVSTDVMEHVLNVGSFLYSVNRAVKMGGQVAIRVPYREGLLNYSKHLGYQHEFGHLRSFDKPILRIYLEQAGFAVESFHLDGFSPGTPQPHLYSTNRRKALYHRLFAMMNRHLEHPADATLWNSQLARLVMRPVEIVVVGRKLRDL